MGSNILFKLNIEAVYVILYSSILSILIFSIYAIKKRIVKLLVIIGFLAGSLIFTMSVDYVFNNVLQKHHRARINELLGIESNPRGIGYHLHQSKIAIGSGGISGKGFLKGTQTRFDFVPEQSTDFIFAQLEKNGAFWGQLLPLCCFLLCLFA